MPRDDLKQIVIDDFRPGIIANEYAAINGGGTTSIKINGAAQKNNTFGCFADPITGALTPLPLGNSAPSSTRLTLPKLAVGQDTSPAWYPSNHAYLYNLDSLVVGGLRTTASEQSFDADGAPGTDSDYVMQMFSYWYDPAGNGSVNGYHQYVWGKAYNLMQTSNVQDTFGIHRSNNKINVAANGFHLHSAFLERWLRENVNTTWSPGTALPTTTALRPVVVRHVDSPHTQVLVAASTALGTEVNLIDSVQRFAVGANFNAGDYFVPDVSAGATTQRILFGGPGPTNSSIEGRVSAALAHQGRMVYVVEAENGFGISHNAPYGYLHYTPFGRDLSTSPLLLSTGEEAHSLFGSAGSLNANELVLIKRYGGAVVVRGDLDNPSIFRYPGVEGTYGAVSRGCSTPEGFVYGSRSGVYAWNGGDSAKKLSENLFGDFWKVPYESGVDQWGSRGRFCYWHPFILAPNNFVYDTRTKAWWKLEDNGNDDPTAASAFNAYDVSAQSGKMYAFHSRSGQNAPGTLTGLPYKVYDVNTQRGSYSWTSQPLPVDLERMLWPEEMEIRFLNPSANTGGSVSFIAAVTGQDASGTVLVGANATKTITSSVSGYNTIRMRFGTNGVSRVNEMRYVTLTLTASGVSVAPTIAWARFSYRDAQSFPYS